MRKKNWKIIIAIRHIGKVRKKYIFRKKSFQFLIFNYYFFHFRWDDLKNRVVEHNIRIMAKYYTKVTLKRMSELLDLKVEETEDFLSKMVR